MGRRPNDEKIEVVNIRMVKEPSLYSDEKMRTPEDVLKVIGRELSTYDREVFAVLNLKANGQPINLNICSAGTIDASIVSPREVFKSCILSNSAAFVAIHNHPSGSTSPSQEDKDVTKRLLNASELLGVRMLDHIIVAGETGEIYSFKSERSKCRLMERRTAKSRYSRLEWDPREDGSRHNTYGGTGRQTDHGSWTENDEPSERTPGKGLF